MHLRNGKAEVKPNFFSQAETKGCSIQREAISTDEELKALVSAFERKCEQQWQGALPSSSEDVRQIRLDDSEGRAVCIYDTALRDNGGHADLLISEHVIEHADRLETRRKLLDAFNKGKVCDPKTYRDGALIS